MLPFFGIKLGCFIVIAFSYYVTKWESLTGKIAMQRIK
jgi:hypothetical protein